MKKSAFIFPGQGAQYVGMGKDFYDQFPAAREVFQEADDLLKEHLSTLIFEGPAEVLTETKNSQVAIFVTSVALLRAMQSQFPELAPSVCAGLSLGEYSALCAAEKIPFKECLFLVRHRGQYMNEACEITEGTMRVVLGMEPDQVEAIVNSYSKELSVWVANLNCPGQIVISGKVDGIEKISEILKEKGAKRVLPLKVSGAFHSGLMQSAREKLRSLIEHAPFKESSIEIVMNVPGDFVTSLSDLRANLIDQVTAPVRWEKGVRTIMHRGIDLFIEIGCGTTLTGMNKKIEVGVPSLSIDKVIDLEQLVQVV
jgi:[acyl-carrier-protein] S-malonyltransferase